MSDKSTNPYKPPRTESKLTASEAADVKHRDIAVFVLLCVVTLGIYWFYLAYHWAKELNGLHGRVKYQPVVVLLVSIVTCGIVGMVFECLYAFDIAQIAQSRGVARRLEHLATWVIACNCVAMAVSFIPYGVVVGCLLGTLASALVQVELNKLADMYGTSP